MAGYLLDTNIAIALRDDAGDVTDRVTALGLPTRLSVVTVVELRGGLHRGPTVAAKRAVGLDLLSRRIPVLTFDNACAEAYGRIIAASGYSRPRILDRMIAATALVGGLTLVTANPPDFTDVPGLTMERWPAV